MIVDKNDSNAIYNKVMIAMNHIYAKLYLTHLTIIQLI